MLCQLAESVTLCIPVVANLVKIVCDMLFLVLNILLILHVAFTVTVAASIFRMLFCWQTEKDYFAVERESEK